MAKRKRNMKHRKPNKKCSRIHGGRLWSNFKLWQNKQPVHKNRATINKEFHTPFGQLAQATETAQLHHKVWEPANKVNTVPRLQHNSLLSINKFSEANYTTVFMPDEVNIFNGKQESITDTHQPIIQGWRNPATGLQQIPMKPSLTSNPTNESSPTKNNKQQNQKLMCTSYPAQNRWYITTMQQQGFQQNNMDKSNKSRVLWNVAHANSNSSHKILPRVRLNTNWTYAPKQTRPPAIKTNNKEQEIHATTKGERNQSRHRGNKTHDTNQTRLFPVVSSWGNWYIM